MCPKRYWHNYIGYNYRLTNLQAAIGVAQLEQLRVCREKISIMSEYNELLSTCEHIELLPSVQSDSIHSSGYLLSYLKMILIETPF